MHDYVLTMLAAAAVTFLLTPLVRRFAIAIGAMHAARDRDVHVVPTPLLGGFAMYAGLAAALLVASRLPTLSSVIAQTNLVKGLLLSGGLLVIMGFIDDRWGMSVISKLAGQVAAGVILVWSGAAVYWLPIPGGQSFVLTSDQQTAVTILLVVVTINAVNFIDGLDGLAAGIVGIGAAALFIYYYTLIHRVGLPEQAGPALASALLVGVCLGFLPHNFHPARIFMGDTGAMLIGLLLAYAPISSLAALGPGALTNQAVYVTGTVNRYGEFLPLLLPAAILLIPYADLLLAVVRRTRAGRSPFAPDKKHLHHRLLAIGHSHRTSVLIMYLWAALFTSSVVWLSIVRTPLPVLAAVTVGGVLALLLVSLPRLRPWARSTVTVPVTPAAPGRAAPASAGVAPAPSAGVAPAPSAGVAPAPASAGVAPAPVTPSGVASPVRSAASVGPAAVGGPAVRAPVAQGAAVPGLPARAPAGLAETVPQPAVGGRVPARRPAGESRFRMRRHPVADRQSPPEHQPVPARPAPVSHQPAGNQQPPASRQPAATRQPPVTRQAGTGPEVATPWRLPAPSPVGSQLPPVPPSPPAATIDPLATGQRPVMPAGSPPWLPAPPPGGWPQFPSPPG